MTTEWEFSFLNTGIIIFCFISSLNIRHSTQNPYFSCWTLSIHFFKIHISATFHHTVVVVIILKKIISTFLFTWFYHRHGRPKYELCSFDYHFQALNPNSIGYFRFIDCYGKANKKRISWHSETWLDINYLLESQ